MDTLQKAIWVSHTLFNKGLVSGSTGNISFREDDMIYVSKSGCCFGLIDENSFAKIGIDGTIIEGDPSKEWPMHLKLYQNSDSIKSVIHTHSTYSTIVSCIDNIDNRIDLLFQYTPYLRMQTQGKIGVVGYGKPGSQDLFDQFNAVVKKDTNTYLLKNHGVFVCSNDPLKSFYIIEEFEQSSKILIEIEEELKFKSIDE